MYISLFSSYYLYSLFYENDDWTIFTQHSIALFRWNFSFFLNILTRRLYLENGSRHQNVRHWQISRRGRTGMFSIFYSACINDETTSRRMFHFTFLWMGQAATIRVLMKNDHHHIWPFKFWAINIKKLSDKTDFFLLSKITKKLCFYKKPAMHKLNKMSWDNNVSVNNQAKFYYYA